MPGNLEQWTWLTNGKPVIAAAILVLLWILESIAPMFTGRGRRVSHDLSNLALGLINAVIVVVCFAAAMLLVTEWARRQPFGLLHWFAQLPGALPGVPAWTTWPIAIVLFDAWMYGWHVLNHKVPLLWRFHAVHHADREVDASTALRFHTGEIILSSIARLAVLPLIGLTMPQLLLYESLLLPVILFHHSNVRVPPRLDALARYLIVTPRMHWVHHSRWRPETDSNFASILSIWDRLFGTFRLRDEPRELQLGLDDDGDERQWRTLRGMLLRPLRSPGPRPNERHASHLPRRQNDSQA